MSSLHNEVKEAVKGNDGKLPYSFLMSQVSAGSVTYLHPTDNMRLCIIRLTSGHEVLGVAQVLDAKNDVESIGNEVALENATNELWKVFGAIALS